MAMGMGNVLLSGIEGPQPRLYPTLGIRYSVQLVASDTQDRPLFSISLGPGAKVERCWVDSGSESGQSCSI